MRINLLFLVLVFIACTTTEKEIGKAQQVVDEAIEKAGGQKFRRAKIDFDFRDMHYRSVRKEGIYSYYRILEDSNGRRVDQLNNEGFARELNGKTVVVHDTMAVKYSNSINSVIYFALLPYGLNDPAVNKEYLGTENIENVAYDKIKVTFEKEGGGVDYQDIFVYWFNKDSATLDYMAYEYYTDGGGQRFRKAFNPRYVQGIRFVDYSNYKPKEELENIENMGEAYRNDKLEKLSEIILKNVEVELN